MMKKIVGLAAGLLMTVLSFGQATVSFMDSTPDYNKTAVSEFNFVFDASHTAEDIKASAAYYESYFNVTVTPEGAEGANAVKISLIEDNEMARRIIMRLLVNMEIDMVDVNGTDIERNDFMVKFIMVD